MITSNVKVVIFPYDSMVLTTCLCINGICISLMRFVNINKLIKNDLSVNRIISDYQFVISPTGESFASPPPIHMCNSLPETDSGISGKK